MKNNKEQEIKEPKCNFNLDTNTGWYKFYSSLENATQHNEEHPIKISRFWNHRLIKNPHPILCMIGITVGLIGMVTLKRLYRVYNSIKRTDIRIRGI